MMKVRIFRPAKTAMQSGRGKTVQWILEGIPATRKEPNPLTGWVSSADTFGQIRLTFPTQEEAIDWARQQGWDYMVLPDHQRTLKPKSYADNFAYRG
jgi:hypothetical protein